MIWFFLIVEDVIDSDDELRLYKVYPFILIGGFVGNYIGEEYIPEEGCEPLGNPEKVRLAYFDRQGKLKLIQL